VAFNLIETTQRRARSDDLAASLAFPYMKIDGHYDEQTD
jgi:hypothetical protein